MSNKHEGDLSSVEKAAKLLIEFSGDDIDREGLKNTPHRVAKAYRHIFSGYSLTARDAAGKGVFKSESPGLVSINQIDFYSLCEHHMLPFWGWCGVGYFPNDKILGLSKIPRIVEVFSRRMQVQERMTQQVCDAIVELIKPRAVYVRFTGQHMCMMMRGVEKGTSHTITEAMYGTENLSDIEKNQLLTVPTMCASGLKAPGVKLDD